jgi:hypothetical protein
MVRYYEKIMSGFVLCQGESEILQSVLSDHTLINQQNEIEQNAIANSRASRETKTLCVAGNFWRQHCAALYAMPDFLQRPLATITGSSIRRRRGDLQNMQLTHKYCNHGLKELLHGSGQPEIPIPDFLKTG